MKKGLILEGGAMRGMFTAGVMDVMMENGIEYDGAVGVSAGAVFGCNYKSKQIGRILRYNTKFCKDRRYSGLYAWITDGNIFSKRFCYDIVPLKYDIFDLETYEIKVNGDPTRHDDIVDALNAGKLILSRRKDGAIVIEKDQNTLHTFTPTQGYIFSKNRPTRVMDQAGNDIPLMFNKSYLGKVDNDDEGREIFKNDLVVYFKTLEGMKAIQNFSADDVQVLPGNDSDAVIVEAWIQPIDSMEKLYMKVNVQG